MTDFDSSGFNFGKSYGNKKFIPYDTSLSKLLKDRFLCDVTIRVNTTTVPAHRVILSASSSFFHDLFNNVETINKEYDLTNVFIEPDNLDKILIYIYQGYVKINCDNIDSLLTMNKVLGMSSLDNHCAQFLLSKMRRMDVFNTWQTAWKYNLKELANISQIVCKESMCDVLVGKPNVIMLCEEFLSYVLATEVMMTLSPQSVVRMLFWWTSARKFDNSEKMDKFLSLIDIYLSWKTLPENEMKDLIRTIGKCFRVDPELSMSRLESWSRNIIRKNISQFAIEEIDDTLKNSLSLDYRQNWSLLVAENDIVIVGIYCNTKSKWFIMQAVDDHLNMIGFFNNFLVIRHYRNSLLLRNVQTLTQENLSASRFTNDDSVSLINTKHYTFFIHLNNIYSVDAVKRINENETIYINRWDQQRNEWIRVLHLNPELSDGILPMSLTVETSDGDEVYLFMTICSLHKPKENTTESTEFKGKFVIDFGEEDPIISRKLLKMFCVFCINMKDFSYRQIGKQRNEPTNLSQCRKIILQDKIIFLLDPDIDLERKFGYAYHKRDYCHLSCLQLLLDGENCWMTLTLRVPFPDVRDISIRKYDIECLDCSVTTCKNLLFVGIHWCPHVFQVFKYDMSTLIVSSLPAIPLPAISRMSIQALLAYQPICDLLNKEIRLSDSLNLHFYDWSLLSWDGTLN